MTPPSDQASLVWRRPRPTRIGYQVDVWTTLAIAGGTALSVWLTRSVGVLADSSWWLSALWVLAITLPLAARRRWPEVVAVWIGLVFMLGSILGTGDGLFSSICLYVAIYSVGAWSGNRLLAFWTRVLIVAGMFVWLLWGLIVQAGQSAAVPDLSRDGVFSPYLAFGVLQVLINLLYFWAAWHFGDAAWQSARQSAALHVRTRELAEERTDERVRADAQAVTVERLRIARELHDVLAHHVSVMGIQAGAARRILNRDPAAASAALTAIEDNARLAIDELATMLGALRIDDQWTAGTATSTPPAQPGRPAGAASTQGVAQLADLASESRSAGVPVSVNVVGEPLPVPAVIGLSIYRIAQEALTNTRKHAGTGAAAQLRLRYEADAVELEITDDGASQSLGTPNAGLGQQGMRERVAAVGGELTCGPRARGGFLVRARFPLPQTRASPAVPAVPAVQTLQAAHS